MTADRLKEVAGIITGTEVFKVQKEGESLIDAIVRAGVECNVTKPEVEEVLAGLSRKAA